MKVFGYAFNADVLNEDPLLVMQEVSFKATADEIRLLAEFLKDVASEMDQFGETFGHRHFCDYCKKRGIPLADGRADVIVGR